MYCVREANSSPSPKQWNHPPEWNLEQKKRVWMCRLASKQCPVALLICRYKMHASLFFTQMLYVAIIPRILPSVASTYLNLSDTSINDKSCVGPWQLNVCVPVGEISPWDASTLNCKRPCYSASSEANKCALTFVLFAFCFSLSTNLVFS